MKFLVVLALVGLAAASKIESNLLSKNEANIMVSFGGTRSVLNSIETKSFANRADRLNALHQSLTALAEKSQSEVKAHLTKNNVAFRSFWITNQIYIKGASQQVMEALAAFPKVSQITEEVIMEKSTPVFRGNVGIREPTPLAEWGIEKINAPAAWNVTNGTGTIVMNIDGGVHYSHEALSANHRADYGWMDPADGTENPWDEDDGHGTHTMGSIAGSHGIGVAPGAGWIACKGCGLISCPQSDLIACGQFAACPTTYDGRNPDCSKAPNLVSNSWGGGRGSTWYEEVTEAWIAAGIVPLFSQGNSGASCNTANSPGDMRRVIGVGATDINDQIASFSSTGPTADNRLKPEISGPGANIRSSMPGAGNNVYGTMSGTSMSCPHAAGVMALILSVNPRLDFGEARRILIESVDTDLPTGNRNCGGIPDTTFPNHVHGYGRINALKAVQHAQKTLN